MKCVKDKRTVATFHKFQDDLLIVIELKCIKLQVQLYTMQMKSVDHWNYKWN